MFHHHEKLELMFHHHEKLVLMFHHDCELVPVSDWISCSACLWKIWSIVQWYINPVVLSMLMMYIVLCNAQQCNYNYTKSCIIDCLRTTFTYFLIDYNTTFASIFWIYLYSNCGLPCQTIKTKVNIFTQKVLLRCTI